MTPSNHITGARMTKITTPRLALSVLALLLAMPTLAQGVYRIVGPDGRVSFSDKPPAADTAPVAGASASSATSANAQLPYELRQVVARYPVTLYTSDNCAPCNSGRILLNARGVPYTEKQIKTADDNDALQRLSGATSLPFLTIGAQQIKGYSDTEWTQFLNAANYPAKSVLPSNYRRPAPTPMVAVKAPEAPAVADKTDRSPTLAPDVPVAPPAQNSSGIRF